MKTLFEILLILAVLLLLAFAAGAQPIGSNVTLVPTNQPPLKMPAKKTVSAPAGTKPATMLTRRPAPPTPPAPRYLAVLRGPSPYDDDVNIDTFVEATPALGQNVTWTPVASGHTNRFIFDRTVTNQYWRMKFGFNTN